MPRPELCNFFGGGAFAQEMPPGEFDAVQFVTGLEGTSGGTVGPDGALYVAESATGRISASIHRPERSRPSPVDYRRPSLMSVSAVWST